MGLTQNFDYHPLNNWGDAVLAVYDDDRASWFGIGLISNPRLSQNYDKRSKMARINGERQEVETRVTSRTCELSFQWKETLNPRGNQMVFGDKTSTQTYAGFDLVGREFECEMYRNDQSGLYIARTHPWQSMQANYTRLPAPATFTVTVSAGGTGAGWATAGNPDYYAWAQPLFLYPGAGVVPALTTVMDAGKLDYDWCLGAPFDYASGSTGYNGSPVNFTNATDEVKFTGTAPATGPTPDYVVIWINTTDDLATATACQIITWATFIGAGTLLLTLPAGDTYAESRQMTMWGNFASRADTTGTQLVENTDFTWDNDIAEATLKGGSYNARTVKWRLFLVEAPNFTQPYGGTGISVDNRKVALINLEPQVDGDDPLYAEGEIFILYRADWAGIANQIPWTDDNWVEGMDITCKVTSDPANSNLFGSRQVMSPAFKTLVTQAQLYR